jgi:DNA polymerase III subunit gamma/tau
VYIIDEVHMLSDGAFNALLKTLEEPPKHVKFVLATTEIDKVPETIRSRSLRFDFERIQKTDIVSRLRFVAEQEKIEVSDICLTLIAESAHGGMRDALTILEQQSTL